MSRWVFDIETDGFLNQCTRMWILAAYNLDTKKMHYWLEGQLGWQETFKDAKLIIGHNILGFDVFVLKKLFGFEFSEDCSFVDTLILSQVLDYRRFGDKGHSLEAWGEHFGYYKKQHEDWSQYSEDMKERCLQDVRLNVKVYNEVISEYKAAKAKSPQIEYYIKSEHAVAKWCAMASLYGWPFDLEKANELKNQLEVEMLKAETALQSKLGMKVVPLDKEGGEVVPKQMKYNKDGRYNSVMARFFGIDPVEGLLEDDEKTIVFGGEFCRLKIEPLSLSSSNDVKLFLFRNGWVPTEWNYKKDKEGKFIYEKVGNKKQRVKSSPKITEDSLEILGGDGKLYPEYLTAKSRYSILKTWIEETDSEGNLHGDCMTIGTPSMRARHSIIVNVPSADSPWGKEMRQLFISRPGWKLIGCDSEGNQARGLAHYLQDEGFTDTLLNGDIHQYNADILTAVCHELRNKDDKLANLIYSEFVVARPQAKRILYAFLFGAGGPKLWSYIFGMLDDFNGAKLKTGFTKAVPGFQNLLDSLSRIYSTTSSYETVDQGYINSIAGNRIYVDSFHKLLVYLLQSCEKITCSAACMLLMQWLEERKIPYQPCIMMHDELDFLVPEEHAEEARELGKLAFAEGPKLFGIKIMGGSGKIGDNWYEVH